MPFPLDIRYIRETEAQLGRALPAGYVERMCRLNGGVVMIGWESFDLHPILDTSDRTRLKRTCNDIVRETESNRQLQPDDFPPDAVAVAADGGGDALVFLPAACGTRFDSAVYRWSHETGELTRVAERFELLG